MIELPDTLVWRQLRRLASIAGVESIALRHSGGPSAAGRYADVTWPGCEVESVRLPPSEDPDELARALAHELRIAL